MQNYAGETNKKGVPNGFGICFNPILGVIAEGYFDKGLITGFSHAIVKKGDNYTTGRVLCVNRKEIFSIGNR